MILSDKLTYIKLIQVTEQIKLQAAAHGHGLPGIDFIPFVEEHLEEADKVMVTCEVTKYESLLCQVLLKPQSPKYAARLLGFTAECTCATGKPWVEVVQTHLADLVQDALDRTAA